MSNPLVSLNLTNNIPSTSTKTFPRYRRHGLYHHTTSNSGGCGLPDLYDIADGIGTITINDADKLEANLVMELVRARRDLFRAEQSLTDCVVRECELMASLLKFKSNISAQKLNKADLGLGCMRITFKKHSLSHHVPAHDTSKSANSIIVY
ncbi:uncharacterized protein F5147DRAFT_771203 [Suillus discolor]|uniref:Uncharacterized protein n=1 Tax=Suillus discolor TaxID=1912936 RepID=A0A9P7FCE5_9AGAM|nr:uncharacterized protein F5147DRAFT_771203 [Suillus discolor]KAG2112657.1 hypothetical protein F5147DRAFT_771203 [Suillus discolor]